jgi:hypothetical protein
VYVLFLLLVKYSPALEPRSSLFVARTTNDDLVCIVSPLFSEQFSVSSFFFFFFARCWEVEMPVEN